MTKAQHNCGGNRRNDSNRPTFPRPGTPNVFCRTGNGLALSFGSSWVLDYFHQLCAGHSSGLVRAS